MIVDDTYLLLTKTSEFNNRLTKYFYNRLQLFLNISGNNVPKLIFSTKVATAFCVGEKPCRAFFDEYNDRIVFNSSRYNYKGEQSYITHKDIPLLHEKYDFKYVVPLSDIYHEMVHHVQYNYIDGLYDYIDYVEAVADIYCYIITGQWNIDYLSEAIAFWYISTKILKCNDVEFYVMLRNAIVDENFFTTYWMSNKNFIKLLGKKYDGTLSQFLHNFKKDFGDRKYEEEFYNSVSRIHNLIFYKY